MIQVKKAWKWIIYDRPSEANIAVLPFFWKIKSTGLRRHFLYRFYVDIIVVIQLTRNNTHTHKHMHAHTRTHTRTHMYICIYI